MEEIGICGERKKCPYCKKIIEISVYQLADGYDADEMNTVIKFYKKRKKEVR